MTHIVIVEDEERISSFMAKGLKAAGYAVSVAGTVREGLMSAAGADLVILDLGLPDGDGLSVLRSLRDRGDDVPVIILSARTAVNDTVAGLDLGADDYMPKPLRFEELLARVRLRLKKTSAQEDAVTLSHGSLTLDLRTRRASVNGKEVDLSAREFSLAETLLRHSGQVLSREQLLAQVWGYDYDPGSNVVDVYIGYLRKKFGQERIETVRGMGYRLRDV
ncbi:MAG: response regulator transcription factor [Propionibacteriaceae bacterium]|nr:response regulator transcription factor [Propionibacteriaceae bacterium]